MTQPVISIFSTGSRPTVGCTFGSTWVEYETLSPGRLILVPPDDQLAIWRSDYAAMGTEMFFGQPPAFEDLIETVREFQNHFNATNRGHQRP